MIDILPFARKAILIYLHYAHCWSGTHEMHSLPASFFLEQYDLVCFKIRANRLILGKRALSWTASTIYNQVRQRSIAGKKKVFFLARWYCFW